jgi:hypothetical protein
VHILIVVDLENKFECKKKETTHNDLQYGEEEILAAKTAVNEATEWAQQRETCISLNKLTPCPLLTLYQ